jgi:HTH-type transcriptional regulator, sugar sensing transcriptional regulator
MSLLQTGPMAPADLARRTGIPSGRVYDILASLDKKGLVRKIGGRPVKFDAEHPRSVVNQEIQRLQDIAEKELSQAEAAWEVRRDERELGLGNCWTVTSFAGFAREVKTCIKDANRSVVLFDSDLTWISGRDAFAMKEALGRGVSIQAITSERSQEHLKGLRLEKVKVKTLENRSEAYYIFDDKRVLVKLLSPDGAVVFENPTVAQILISHNTRLEKDTRPAK